MKVPIAGTPLTPSRIDLLLSAQTAGQAVAMGPLDRILDCICCGTKRAAVQQIFDAITQKESAACGESDTLRRLERFGQLRALADPATQCDFTIDVKFDKQAGNWSVAFHVGDTAIHCCRDLPLTDTAALHACLDSLVLSRMTPILEANLAAGRAHDTEDLLAIAAGPAIERPDETDPDAYLAARIGQCVRGLPPSLRCEFAITAPLDPGDSLVWSCTLADTCLYQGTLPLTTAQDLAAAARVAVHGLETMLERAFAENAPLLLNQDAFIEGCLECMTDDRAQRATRWPANRSNWAMSTRMTSTRSPSTGLRTKEDPGVRQAGRDPSDARCVKHL